MSSDLDSDRALKCLYILLVTSPLWDWYKLHVHVIIYDWILTNGHVGVNIYTYIIITLLYL